MPSTLRKGSKGDDVKTLQRELTKHVFPTKVDGDFGPGTKAQVLAFQKSKGLGADGVVGGGTWGALEVPHAAAMRTPNPLQGMRMGLPIPLAKIKDLGFRVYTEEGRLNLFGIRSPTIEANSFDDILGVCYKLNGEWHTLFWPGTTDPGTYWLKKPSKVAGTAILVEGQYHAWKIDKHGGRYEALCQRASEVAVYRDGDRDNKLETDPNTIERGWFGINCHRSSTRGGSTRVEKWSAGCQVHARYSCFQEMMRLARFQRDKLPKEEVFAYTLMKQWW